MNLIQNVSVAQVALLWFAGAWVLALVAGLMVRR